MSPWQRYCCCILWLNIACVMSLSYDRTKVIKLLCTVWLLPYFSDSLIAMFCYGIYLLACLSAKLFNYTLPPIKWWECNKGGLNFCIHLHTQLLSFSPKMRFSLMQSVNHTPSHNWVCFLLLCVIHLSTDPEVFMLDTGICLCGCGDLCLLWLLVTFSLASPE